MELYKDGKSSSLNELKRQHRLNFKDQNKVVEALVREGYAVVLPTPKPTPTTDLKLVIRDGVTTDALGNTVQAWTEVDMFKDYTDENGIVVTKAEQEEAYLHKKFKDSVPQVISMRQARLALLNANLLSTVETAITNGTDEAMKIEWEYATEVRRDWESLITMATALGMTETDLDNLFIAGGEI